MRKKTSTTKEATEIGARPRLLTNRATRATMSHRCGSRQTLDSYSPRDANSAPRKVLDEREFFQLVNLLVPLDRLGFEAVVAAARFCRQFDEKRQPVGKRGGAHKAQNRAPL
jgi:hypothetical protein